MNLQYRQLNDLDFQAARTRLLDTMPRYFAIVPAAGLSQRMGAPKLLLPLDGQPLIAATLRAWRQSRVDHVLVVVRSDDPELANAVGGAGGELVVPDVSPPDMKASVQAALRQIEAKHDPTARDAFLVAPADIPRLSPAVIDLVIASHELGTSRIVAPTLGGKRGHPVLFPWTLCTSVFELPENAGLNTVVDRENPLLIACDNLTTTGNETFADVDTPEDYARLASRRPPE